MRRGWSRALVTAALAALAFGVAGAPAGAKPGELDLSFGLLPGHTIAGSPPVTDPGIWVGELVALPGGGTLSTQRTADRTVIVKRGPDGGLVEGFGRRGNLLLPLTERRNAGAWIEVQGERIVVLSTLDLKGGTVLLIQSRDLETGSLERRFGKAGTARFKVTDYLTGPDTDDDFQPSGIEVDRKGRIYLAGSISWSNGPGLMLRLRRNGLIDRSFGKQGAIVSNRGKCRSFNDIEVTTAGIYALVQDCLRRFRFDGTPDPGFSTTPHSGLGHLREIATAGSSAVYVVMTNDGEQVNGILKLRSDGSPDPGYGEDGFATAGFPDVYFTAASVAGNGEVVYGGQTYPFDASLSVGRLTSEGEPDQGFSDDGLMTIGPDLDWESSYPLMAIVPGAVLMTGEAKDHFDSTPKLARILDDGTFDQAFGEGGIRDFGGLLPPMDEVLDSLRMPGGGTVVAGRSNERVALLRLDSRGRVERTWGEAGWLRFRVTDSWRYESARALGLAEDGSVLACLATGSGTRVAKITPDGQLEGGFGSGGSAPVGKIRRCSGIAPAPGGGILIGGAGAQSVPVVARLDASGALDSGYGEEGYARGESIWSRGGYRVAFLAFEDGSALVAGPEFVTKFDPAGMRSASFGEDGAAWLPERGTLGLMEQPVAMAETPDGSLLLGGHSRYEKNRLLIVKLTAEGRLASGFGSQGLVSVPTSAGKPELTDLKVQEDGRIVISSTNRYGYTFFRHYLESATVFRLLASGKSDREFGDHGRVSLTFGQNSRASSLTINRFGIVVAGFAETNGGRSEALVFRLKR